MLKSCLYMHLADKRTWYDSWTVAALGIIMSLNVRCPIQCLRIPWLGNLDHRSDMLPCERTLLQICPSLQKSCSSLLFSFPLDHSVLSFIDLLEEINGVGSVSLGGYRSITYLWSDQLGQCFRPLNHWLCKYGILHLTHYISNAKLLIVTQCTRFRWRLPILNASSTRSMHTTQAS